MRNKKKVIFMDIDKESIMKTGTTTVCIKSKEGVVLAADKRARIRL